MDDIDADYEPPSPSPSSPAKAARAPRSPTPSDDDDADRHARLTQVVAKPIQRLEADVVNKIAAGEIIHRPANALKELIENSLDAGATLIRITLKDGGIKLLQIQDNGSGVRSEDLPMLCERFATSKLRDFSDLSKMTTFGFRGEALASISYVSAGMSVVSKTRDEACAYKAHYSQGRLVAPKPGQSSAPKPCAGTDGTLISAEDLFYNVPQRLQALRGPAEEYTRALEVATKYAVHYGGRGVGFICKKAGSNMTDLSLPSSETQTTLDTIRQVYGATIARELVRLKPLRSSSLHFNVEGWISGANWSTKRTTFLCFINHRLVDCAPLKRALEAVYSTLLPRGGHPWIYISLEIQPDKIDVNVHPTKREVRFLNEDEIIEAICEHAQSVLAGANSSRTFSFTQALLPGASVPDGGRAGLPSSSQAVGAASRKRSAMDSSDGIATNSGGEGSRTQRGPSKVDPRKLVRTDAKTRTLDSMQGFTQLGSTKASAAEVDPLDRAEDEGASEDEIEGSLPPATAATSRAGLVAAQGKGKIAESECTLTSVREMRKAIVRGRHVGLTEIFQSHTFVGVVDVDVGLSLLQNSTRLYLVRHLVVIREFAYQLVVRQFGSLARVRLDPPPSLGELVRLGTEMEDERERSGVDVDEVVERVCKALVDRAEMLDEYFSIRLASPASGSQSKDAARPEDWLLETMPALIPAQAAVVLERLPTFALRMGLQVRWREEKGCFEDVCREIARAHVPLGSAGLGGVEDVEHVAEEDASMTDGLQQQSPTRTTQGDAPTSGRRAREEASKSAIAKSKWQVQHVWFPAMSGSRGAFLPPKSLLTDADEEDEEGEGSAAKGASVMQVANLPDLYRVFERC